MKSTIENWCHNSIKFCFKNGNTIDAVFGRGTYSDNYDMPGKNGLNAYETFADESTTVESMFNCSKKLTKKIEKKYGEQPLLRISIDDWFDIANKIRNEIK